MGKASRREHVVAIVALAVVACLWFWPLFDGRQLTQSYTLYYGAPWAASRPVPVLPPRAAYPDVAVTFHPWAVTARRQIERGELPLWNPYEYGGMTLLGNMQSGLLFPLNWPLLFLPFGVMWGFMALAKVLLAGLGAYALSRQLKISRDGGLLAGTVYMLSAPIMAWLQWPLASIFALFPWFLLATDRLYRRTTAGAVAGVGVAFLLTILAGHPESALLLVSAGGLYLGALLAFDRKRGGGLLSALRVCALWAAGLALGALASAVALLPFLEAFWPSVTRTTHILEGFPYPIVPRFAALDYLIPGFIGDGEPVARGSPFYSDVAGYFGVPALLLAGLALMRYRRRPAAWALAVTAAVFFAAAFGLPPVIWFATNVYPWSDIVLAGRAFFVIALAGAVGAGAAFMSFGRRPLSARGVAAVMGVAVLAIGLALVAGYVTDHLPSPASVWHSSAAWALVAVAATGALLLALGRVRTRLVLPAALALCVFGVIGLQNFNVMLAPRNAYPPTPPSVETLTREPGTFRAAVIRDRRKGLIGTMPANAWALYGIEGTEGFDFPLSERWSDFETSVLGHEGFRPESRRALGVPDGPSLSALRMINTRYYLADPEARTPVAGFRPVYRGRDATLFRDPAALPRAYVVPATRALSYRRALAALQEGSVDPRRLALVPLGTPPPPRGAEPRFRPARVERLSNDHVRVHLASGSEGWLVLANAYSDAWKAEVDGRDAEVRPTNFALMGVPVSASARTVDFRLDRTSVNVGGALTLAGIAVLAVLAAWGPLRRRRRT